MKIVVHCSRGESDAHARRVHALFGCPAPEPAITSGRDETLQRLQRPFLLLAHESELEPWDDLYQAVQMHLAGGEDWAVIRFSLGAPDQLGPIVPGDRHLAVLRNGVALLLNHLEQAEQLSRLADFRASVCAGRPDFSQLCRKVPDLKEHRSVDTLHRWLAAAEELGDDQTGATADAPYLRKLQGRAAETLGWLAKRFGADDATPALTTHNARDWLQRAQRHPRLDYPD